MDDFWDDTWMSGNLDLSYEDMKVFWERRSFKVNESFVRHERMQIYTYPKSQLLDSYGHLHYVIDGTKSVAFIKTWIRDKNIREYNNIQMYPPPLICPPDHYNTWTDFDIEATSKTYTNELSASDLESKDAYLDHIRILFPHAFDYIVNMFAQIFQQPSQKIGIALVIKGAEGAGKNRLLDLIKSMMGITKYFETSRPQHDVYGKFTNSLLDKVLVIINSDNLYANETLVDMITSKTFMWKAKRRDSKTMPSYCRVVFTMNETAASEFDASDR